MAPAPAFLSLMIILQVTTSITTSIDTKSYIVHIEATKFASLNHSLNEINALATTMLSSLISAEPTPSPELIYSYQTALTGFAAKLTAKQAETLQQLDGVAMLYPDSLLELHTTYSPHFLGLEPGKGLWSSTNLATDIIIGLVDTGIWPEHVSFADSHIGGLPERWKGICEEGTNFSAGNCNKKVIGARAFWRGYEAVVGKINWTTELKSARDSNGHGTHTASTAAGNVVDGAELFGNAKGSARGIRYTARIAVYKACWELGCASSDILAAVDLAVADGVDVLSLSVGGISRPYFMDGIAIAAFGAAQKGVFVTCSAGNSGPHDSTLSNPAPWLMTVAASYSDRQFPTTVKLGDGQTFEGSSLYTGKPTGFVPIVYAEGAGGANANDARFCAPGSLSSHLVKKKIVVCDRGLIGRVEKGEQVKLTGGAGMLVLNSEGQGEELFADAHVLPSSALGAKAAKNIKAYLNSSSKSNKTATASIDFVGTVFGRPAPVMAAFSSRGPSLIDPNIVKPDVTAPGMSILAAWPPTVSPSMIASDQRRVVFNIISGTSMSCPHVSGLAALLKAVHPDWSPAAIKSALMTTAYTLNNKDESIADVSTGLAATPFSFGSGHVNPERASNPGLIYDIATDDYLEYLCSLNYTTLQLATLARANYTCPKSYKDLNYPSFGVVFGSKSKNGRVTQRRTVTNVGSEKCKYKVSIHEPKGVRVTVNPKKLTFSGIGQKLSYEVKFVWKGGGGDDYSFGELIWLCDDFSVRSPIAVNWQ